MPSFEGRYALLVGVKLGLTPLDALFIASLGVATLSIVLPVILPGIDRIANWISMRSQGFLGRLARAYLSYVVRARRRAKPYMESYGLIGLALFVAVPLPGTGVWTGALAGYLLGLGHRRLMPVLLLGGLASNLLTFSLAFILHRTL